MPQSALLLNTLVASTQTATSPAPCLPCRPQCEHLCRSAGAIRATRLQCRGWGKVGPVQGSLHPCQRVHRAVSAGRTHVLHMLCQQVGHACKIVPSQVVHLRDTLPVQQVGHNCNAMPSQLVGSTCGTASGTHMHYCALPVVGHLHDTLPCQQVGHACHTCCLSRWDTRATLTCQQVGRTCNNGPSQLVGHLWDTLPLQQVRETCNTCCVSRWDTCASLCHPSW